MKKILIATTLFLSVTAATFAQDMIDEPKGKSTVFIDYFKRSKDVPASLVESLRGKVIEGIQAMDRVVLIDVDSQDALRIESSRRSSESIDDGGDMERLKEMKDLGAQYIINGVVTMMSSSKKTNDKGKIYYQGSVAYTLKVINTANGTLVGTKTFNHDGLTSYTGDTPEEAITKTCGYAKTYMEDFIDEHFKLEGNILEIGSEKKGKAEEVYINLGSMHGVQKDQKFVVYLEREIAGRKSKKEIGRLSVKAVEGDDISMCKVAKGGEEIKQALGEGSTLTVISRKQTFMGSLLK